MSAPNQSSTRKRMPCWVKDATFLPDIVEWPSHTDHEVRIVDATYLKTVANAAFSGLRSGHRDRHHPKKLWGTDLR